MDIDEMAEKIERMGAAMNADDSPVAVTVSWQRGAVVATVAGSGVSLSARGDRLADAVAELYEGARRDAIATLVKHSRRVDDLRAAIYGGQP